MPSKTIIAKQAIEVVTCGRRWMVWEDDSPNNPDRILTAAEAAAEFLRLVTTDPDAKFEIRQCGEDEIEWAGLDDYDLSTHDVCDGSGNLALPVGDAKLWNPNLPHIGWACPPSIHFEPSDDDDAVVAP